MRFAVTPKFLQSRQRGDAFRPTTADLHFTSGRSRFLCHGESRACLCSLGSEVTSTSFVACLLFFLLTASIVAADPIKLGGSPINPNYFVPVDPDDRQDQEAIEKLLGDRRGNGTMIYTNSSGEAFVLSVWGKDYAKYDYEHALHNFMTFIEVSLEGKGRSTRAVSKKEIQVGIDVDFAIAVQRSWAAMLLKTRYPTGRYLGLDGWQTEFSVSVRGVGGVYGQLWSPSEGLPKELMDLGFALVDYCKAPENQRPEKRKKLIYWLEDFAKRAEASK